MRFILCCSSFCLFFFFSLRESRAHLPFTSTKSSIDFEILHWWTSGSEAKAVGILKKAFHQKPLLWIDAPIAGGDSAMTVLKSRVIGGNPPAASQIKGPMIREYAEEGLLIDLTSLAKANNWDQKLPPAIQDAVKYQGKYFGIPLNVHRGNWLWVNLKVFKQNHLEVPKTWEDFVAVSKILQKKGIIPLALGGQKWQESALFEVVALSFGPGFYRKIFVERDRQALLGPTMTKALDLYRKLKQYTDKSSPGRSWDMTANLVIQGKAAMQVMGDWELGEFRLKKMQKGVDFDCVPTPSSHQAFVFVLDSFALFTTKPKAGHTVAEDNQRKSLFASTLMEKEVQVAFNREKGALPALGLQEDGDSKNDNIKNIKVDKDRLPASSDCLSQGLADFKQASEVTKTQELEGGILPSFAYNMTLDSASSGSFSDKLSQFFNDDKLSTISLQKDLVATLQELD
jgi:glucose/mannose transport system substrate-binding protein